MTASLTVTAERAEQLVPLWSELKRSFPGVAIRVDLDADYGLTLDVHLPDDTAPVVRVVALEHPDDVAPVVVGAPQSPGGEVVEEVEPFPPLADHTPTSPPGTSDLFAGTDREPPPHHDDLAARIVALLHRRGPATAPDIADHFGIEAPDVLTELRALKDAGKVEVAGPRGWKVRRRDFDHDAARARAAEAI